MERCLLPDIGVSDIQVSKLVGLGFLPIIIPLG